MLDAVNNSKNRGRAVAPTIADQEVLASGMSPLAFLCSVYRDAKQPMKRRIEAAKCAAPYLHPRLCATPFSSLLFVQARGASAINSKPPHEHDARLRAGAFDHRNARQSGLKALRDEPRQKAAHQAMLKVDLN